MRSILKTGMFVLMLAATPIAAQAGTLEGVAIGAGSGAIIAGPPGAVVGGVAAVGLVAHGLGSAAKGRIKGVPTETEKVSDAKKKGGDK